MSDPLHEYQLRVMNGSGGFVATTSQKVDLEQIQTEASMVAEIFDRVVSIYSKPIRGGSWQLLQKIDPPKKENG